MRDIENNVFAGEPRLEHDEAWRRILEREYGRVSQWDQLNAFPAMIIKVSQHDPDTINETSIAF